MLPAYLTFQFPVVTDWIVIFQTFGGPTAITFVGGLIWRGFYTTGVAVKSVTKEIAALEEVVKQIDEKRSGDVQRIHTDLEAIRDAFADYKLAIESRLSRLEARTGQVRPRGM